MALSIVRDTPPDLDLDTSRAGEEAALFSRLEAKWSDVAKVVTTDFNRAHKAASERWHPIWRTNARFIDGSWGAHHETWRTILGRFEVPDDPPWRERVTI